MFTRNGTVTRPRLSIPLLVAVVLAGVLAGTTPAIGSASAAPMEIDSCTTITQPGEYVLTEDITNSNADTCIAIQASDVVLDGQGHTVDGVDDFSADGVVVFGRDGATNVTVTNLTVTDWGTGIVYETTTGDIRNSIAASNSRGVALTFGAGGIVVANTTVRENDQQGFYLQSAQGNRFVNNMARDNGWAYGSVSELQEGPSVNNTVENLVLESATVSFESKDIELGAVESPPAVPESLRNVGGYINVSATSEDAFLDLSVRYSDTDAADVEERSLRLFAFTDGEWTPVSESTVDPGANVVSGNVTTLADTTVLAALGEPPSEEPTGATETDTQSSTGERSEDPTTTESTADEHASPALDANESVPGQDSPRQEEEPNDEVANAMPIENGDTVTGEVEGSSGATDTFAIDVQKGATIVAEFSAPEGQITPSLLDPSGGTIDFIDAVYGANQIGRLNTTVTRTGTYYVKIANEAATGSSGQYFVYVEVEGQSETETDSQSSTGDRLPNTITIESTADERVSYEFTASGRVEPGSRANLVEAEVPDAINGSTASGSVALRGVDNYTFSGEITALSLDGGDAQVSINGEPIDPADFQSETETKTPTSTPVPTATTTSTATATPTPTTPPLRSTSTPASSTPTVTPNASSTPTSTMISPVSVEGILTGMQTSPGNATTTLGSTATDRRATSPAGTTPDGQTDAFGPGFGVPLTVVMVIAATVIRLLVARRRS